MARDRGAPIGEAPGRARGLRAYARRAAEKQAEDAAIVSW